MASSEVDQKFLGHFAKTTTTDNNYLSSFLFRVLGLSVILAEKLLQARRAKRLDPVRDPKAKHLVEHILWLAREGLVMVEQYVLPMVGNYVELKVLSYKLKASFYHIFVLFHNDPPVNDRINRGHSRSGSFSLIPDPLSPRITSSNPAPRQPTGRSPPGRQRSPAISLGGPVGGGVAGRTPPGLPIPSTYPYSASQHTNSTATGTATFILPLIDYTPQASAAFKEADDLADRLLPGSHPVRLSVKVEYVAYVYDCLHEAEQSRRMARFSIRQVYEAQEGMDDESFEDAAEMVGILGRMMRRGLGSGGGVAGSGSGGTTGPGSSSGGGRAEGASPGRNPSQSNPRGSGARRNSGRTREEPTIQTREPTGQPRISPQRSGDTGVNQSPRQTRQSSSQSSPKRRKSKGKERIRDREKATTTSTSGRGSTSRTTSSRTPPATTQPTTWV